jgi:hypothetical protein
MWTYLKRLRSGLIISLVLLALAFANITTSFAANIPFITTFVPTAGSVQGGTAVRIYGGNFRQHSVVTFGGVTGSNVLVSDCGSDGNCSVIDVTTPPHSAGPVTVRVTNPSGASATASQFFNYFTP